MIRIQPAFGAGYRHSTGGGNKNAPTSSTTSVPDTYTAPEYLTDVLMLKKVGIYLGPMNKPGYDYAQFMEEAKRIAEVKRLSNPRLVIHVVLKDKNDTLMGRNEFPYAIAESEWDDFKYDFSNKMRRVPHVYVVDGSKYTAPI